MAVIGLDAGSTGCKCIVFGNDGRPHAYAYREYPRNLSSDVISSDCIWENVSDVIREAVAAYRVKQDRQEDDGRILAICISSFGEAFVPLDAAGRALDDIMLYTDQRGLEECMDFCDKFGEENIMRITGVKPHPMYSLPKIAWLRSHKPEVFSQVWKFLLVEDFIIYKLTGKTFTDYSLASRTMAFDIRTLSWNDDLLDLAGIGADRMATPVPSGTAVAKVAAGMSDLLGLDADVQVVTGGHDQVCAAVGSGITSAGAAADGIGTVECIIPAFAAPVDDPGFAGNNYCCVPYPVDNMYVTYAFNFTGGSLLKWFRDNLARDVKLEADKLGIGVYALLEQQIPEEPTSIFVIPHFAGSGTPDMDPAAKAAIYGLTFRHHQSDIFKACLEGVTYEMKYNIDLLKSHGIDIKELYAVGGGSKSLVWLGIKAAITGCTIHQLEVEEAGITGAAIMASVAVGIYPTIRDACDVFIKVRNTIIPDMELHRKYMKLYEEYKRIRNFTVGMK
ncbi:MAG: FGGY-family carbohydrate kinase [Saccharofermentanales bacterium]